MISDDRFALFTRWRIGAFGRKPREICEDESFDELTFEEKVELCVDAEIEARDGRKIERAVRSARFKIKDACVEDIYYLPDRSITRDRIARLASCAWVEARENLVKVAGPCKSTSSPPCKGTDVFTFALACHHSAATGNAIA